jgi:hypothetical protein
MSNFRIPFWQSPIIAEGGTALKAGTVKSPGFDNDISTTIKDGV